MYTDPCIPAVGSMSLILQLLNFMPSHSRIFNHFEWAQDQVTTLGNFKMKCKHCSREVSGSYKATSNFFTHMKRHHADIHQVLKEPLLAETTKVKPTVHRYVNPQQAAWKPTDPRQQVLTDSLVNFLTHSLQPLSRVEDPSFKTLLKLAQPSFVLPTQKQLSCVLLPAKTTSLHVTISSQLAKIQGLCVTVSIWSSRDTPSFLGITGHYIHNFKIKHVMLAFKRIDSSTNAESIVLFYQQVLCRFGIEDKVVIVVVNHASRKLSVTLPGLEQQYAYENDNSAEFDTNVDLTYLPQSLNCFSHTLHLVVQDGLKHAGEMSGIISKANGVVNYINQLSLESANCEGESKEQSPDAVRWNSQLKMLRSILKTNQSDLEQFDIPDKLTMYELNIIKDIVEILSPFELAADQTEKDSQVTASCILPCIRGLRAEMDELSNTYKSQMVSTLKASINCHLTKYENEEAFTLAAALDPRWKLDWCTVEEASNIKQILTNKVSALAMTITETSSADELSSPPKKRSSLFRFMASDSHRLQFPTATATLSQVESYFSQPSIPEDADPLAFWEQHQVTLPQLAQLASMYLPTPASSAPVDRLFSVDCKAFQPEKYSFSNAMFEELMFIRCNGQLNC
ncbi:zinc finger BED domain-containing protein 4-like isoform X2 [Polypterus senegalus]|uniref:zinc finger BED domain-containing protein 4-like isoform X2 n=1 Tax=Polypterus senegalus TaxID=55291 RepID=UPI0019635483|nr:zinc finger BED domain-containing protein 4-like isoform X2 [Polypterus senegalus]